MALLATALMCTAMSTGCGGPPAVHAAPAPAHHAAPRPASRFAISFERSGGLKARVETLVVRPGLRAYATAPKGPKQGSKHFRMNAQTAEEVRKELARAHFADLKSAADPSTCPDCYVYSITYHGHTVLFFIDKIPHGLSEVVDALEGEVIQHLYRHVGYRGA